MITERLEMSRQAALRRAKAAMEKGVLVNLEERRGRPLQLALAEALPERRVLLPSFTPEGALSSCQPRGGDNVTTVSAEGERDTEFDPWADYDRGDFEEEDDFEDDLPF
jgi:hypothetical protein